MNFLKNQLCGDVCGIVNEYLIPSKEDIKLNFNKVIGEINDIVDFVIYHNEENKKYCENELFFNDRYIKYVEESFLSLVFEHIKDK